MLDKKNSHSYRSYEFMNNYALRYPPKIQEVLTEKHLERMSWSANFSEMNPIEHICDYIGRTISRQNNPANVIRNMYKYVQAFIQNIGGNTN